MADQNLVLYVASYPTVQAAEADFAVMKDSQANETNEVTGAAVLSMAMDGEVTVDESGLGSSVASGAKIGAGPGLVLGIFAPPLLIATAIGAGLGAMGGEINKRHQEQVRGRVV